MKTKFHLTLSTIALLSACSLTPDYTRPSVTTPDQWTIEGQEAAQAEHIAWWKTFKNEQLNELIQTALQNNYDLEAGLYTIEQARAQVDSSKSSLLPSLSGSAGASRSANNPVGGNASYSSNLQAGLSASYELDLFGANRAGVNASEADLQGAIYDQEALELSLMGEVATNYFTLLSLRDRLAIADQNVKIAQDILRIMTARSEIGTITDIDLSQQKSAVASILASRESLNQQIRQTENALAILVGQAPQTFEVGGKSLKEIKLPSIASGQPADLLQNRPDLKSLEAGLLAANANIGEARAAFYPSLSIGASTAASVAALGDPSAVASSLSSSLLAPIFSGGANQANLDRVTAQQKQLAEQYKKAILVAFQDVEDALVSEQTASKRLKHLYTMKKESGTAYSLSKDKYDVGRIDYQTLLDTQTSKLSADDSYIQGQLNEYLAAIDLYMALGGEWK